MKTKRGFTLIELLIVITIVIITAVIFASFLSLGTTGDLNPFFWPEQAKVQALRDQADQLRRANDIRERELNLKAK